MPTMFPATRECDFPQRFPVSVLTVGVPFCAYAFHRGHAAPPPAHMGNSPLSRRCKERTPAQEQRMHTEGNTETRELSEDELDLISGGSTNPLLFLSGALQTVIDAVFSPSGGTGGGRGQDIQAAWQPSTPLRQGDRLLPAMAGAIRDDLSMGARVRGRRCWSTAAPVQNGPPAPPSPAAPRKVKLSGVVWLRPKPAQPRQEPKAETVAALKAKGKPSKRAKPQASTKPRKYAAPRI